jgi:hypothetical protein
VPWCDQCNRFLNPPSLTEAGECPTCGRVVAEPKTREEVTVPWHLKLLLVALAIYLLYRAWQGIAWLTHHF